MKALRFIHDQLSIAEIPLPTSDGEALVRIVRSGICNTDLEIVRGYAGFEGTIGHEFVGVVESAVDRPEIVGKRVVGEINSGCGECTVCAGGDPRHCPRRTVLGIVGRDGAHAEYLLLPSQNLLPVPDSVTDDQAVFAEPLAAAYGICERVEISAETDIAVIGDGKLGLLCAMGLRLRSPRVTLMGKHQNKLAIAEKTGVEGVLLGDLPASFTGRFDVVVEASGSASGMATALDIVRPRGRIVLKSTYAGGLHLAASRVVVDEISIVGSRCGRFAPALDLLASGAVIVEDLIEEVYPLDRGIEAMEHAARSGTLKVLLAPTA